ncbi:hypothetical protein BU17DRAFT_56370 [Hysterangium stoloniferum]|nr:hypothetical protein BU17DRAFT_56370 [Hysterangium stoloniferum]
MEIRPTTPNYASQTGKFYLEHGSEPSTRACSPSPAAPALPAPVPTAAPPPPPPAAQVVSEKPAEVAYEPSSAGILPDDVYESTLAWWRVAIRRRLVENLKTESGVLAAMQTRVRTDWLDAYFVYTSTLGTHTFFMTLLPAFFFFGHDRTGRGLVTVIGMGVYWSSFIKDLLCSPRPFSPPVTRLTISNHHLEYGFPSTHSTNSISIILYIHTLIYRFYLTGGITSTALYTVQIMLAWYVFSIIYGRLYCGMHSFTDCTVGMIVGAAAWAAYWVMEDWLEEWIANTGWSPVVMINQHPQPVDDCPCFEDSIAFVSSIVGVLIGQWHRHNFGLLAGEIRVNPVWDTWPSWLFYCSVKLFFGVLTIFTWRLTAKSLLHMILPPIYRSAALLVTLPTRRFYTPATDYEHVPPERGMFPIPSVIDLPSAAGMSTTRSSRSGLKLRGGLGNGNGNGNGRCLEKDRLAFGNGNGNGGGGGESVHGHEAPGRKHYDADVLTKMIVYAGIGMIASEGAPVVFELLGW